jgi:hypothetical protein
MNKKLVLSVMLSLAAGLSLTQNAQASRGSSFGFGLLGGAIGAGLFGSAFSGGGGYYSPYYYSPYTYSYSTPYYYSPYTYYYY